MRTGCSFLSMKLQLNHNIIIDVNNIVIWKERYLLLNMLNRPKIQSKPYTLFVAEVIDEEVTLKNSNGLMF